MKPRRNHPFPCRKEFRTPPPHARVIAISDIHGNLDFFNALLEKIEFSTDDILVLVGDMMEKGPQSLALLRRIMQLEQNHQVWSVCGNCDGMIWRFFDSDVWDEGFYSHYIPDHPESLLRQMASELDISDFSNLPALRAQLREHFYDQWQWFSRLPNVIETPHYIFVHGGLPKDGQLDGIDAWKLMKNDDFMGQNLSFSKYVVVGHWPTTLYRAQYPSAAPLLSRKQKILSIDGGCVLKLDGQLNAVLLPSDDSGQFQWTCYDGLAQVRALSAQKSMKNPINIRWGRSDLSVLSRGDEFSTCLHLESGQTIEILSSFLRTRPDGSTWCEDSTNHLLHVCPGDILSVSQVTSRGILAKKDGITGWYHGEYESL